MSNDMLNLFLNFLIIQNRSKFYAAMKAKFIISTYNQEPIAYMEEPLVY